MTNHFPVGFGPLILVSWNFDVDVGGCRAVCSSTEMRRRQAKWSRDKAISITGPHRLLGLVVGAPSVLPFSQPAMRWPPVASSRLHLAPLPASPAPWAGAFRCGPSFPILTACLPNPVLSVPKCVGACHHEVWSLCCFP